ncbi:Ribosome-binding protein 1 [Babesia ovata]|uniref:Ribosome-binding protein 1 n=1 Tax=Babesia ovata TaxID=189622 RepID=A0A2H6KAC1_9APIC|nr:Ribosome-binding protein 1 [Babesia ovata]GBE59947.1 Ribosome-binding protein 1 [Babesia ovata]
MEGHGIPLGTLKECLQFLMWLNSDSGMQDKVAQNLEKRIDKYFKPPKFTLNNVKSALSKFLENASGFYTRLCYNAQPWSHRGERPDQICNALLECTPKFLTVMYFLWYNVDPSFSQLHGGGWKQNWTGALTGSYWHKNSGGDLDQYLFAKSGDSKHGVIPGGFTSDDEVIYNANVWDRGYPQGYSMARDLDKIVSKEFYNFFRSVFVTSVIADSAKRRENAANAIVLMRTFCDIVLEEAKKSNNGGTLIHELNEGLRQQVRSNNNFICWADLKTHCIQLREKLHKLFNTKKRFDFTGQVTGTGDLNKTALAQKTADWLRTNLVNVRGKLRDIQQHKDGQHLGDYFTKNLFPYGFTFSGDYRSIKSRADVQALMKDLSTVSKQLQENQRDLDRLVEILEGKVRDSCPEDDSKKAEGAQNQGKKADGTPNQSRDASATSPVVNSVVLPQPSGDTGAPGPPGPPGPVTSVPSSTRVRTDQQVVQVQHSAPGPEASPPSPSPPSAPGGAGKPDVPSAGLPSVVPPAPQPILLPVTVVTQSPSVSGSGAGSAGGRGAGSQGGGARQDVGQDVSSVTTLPAAPASDPGSGGGPSSGSGGMSPQDPSNNINNCDGVSMFMNGKSVCYSKPKMPYRPLSDDLLTKLNDIGPRNYSPKAPKKRITSPAPSPRRLPTQPSRTDPVPARQPTGVHNRPVKPYYDPGYGRGRQGGMDVTDLPPDEFWGFAVPDMSDEKQEQIRKKFEADKNRIKWIRRAEEQKFLQKQQEEWTKEVETLEKAGEEWKKRQAEGDRLKKSDDYAIRQQEKRREAVTKISNLIKTVDQRRKQEEELQKLEEEKLMAQLREAEERRRQEEENERKKLSEIRSQHPIVPVSDAYHHYQNEYFKIPTHTPIGFSPFGEDEMPRLEGFNAIPQAPLGGEDVDYLVGQVVQDNSAIERQDKTLMEIHDAERKIYSDNAEREREFQKLKLISKYVDEERKRDMEAAQKEAQHVKFLEGVQNDVILRGEITDFPFTGEAVPDTTDILREGERKLKAQSDLAKMYAEQKQREYDRELSKYFDKVMKGRDAYQPEGITVDATPISSLIRQSSDHLDVDVYVPKLAPQDPSYDLNIEYDSPLPPAAEPLELIGPSTTAIALNFPPIEALPKLPDSVPAKYIHTPDAVKMCVAPWMNQQPTDNSTDIPETELFPAEAPRTVREMLTWLAGLQHTKHEETLQKCIEKAFKRGDDDPSDLRLPVNDSSITADNVIDTIKLAAVFAASVLSAVAPEWKDNVALSATLKPKGSDQSKDPDCCALLCQLRDYAYACCHQLEFLKSQCSRDSKQGGWQECHYGRDVTSNSPLQAFLTDASTSKFETHPFDPCNICLKSRVRMGFGDNDLPRSHETGKCISTILTPTCGGEDPLLTLSSYLTCLTRRTPRTTGELVSFFHNFGNELHDVSLKLSPLGSALSEPHRHCPDWDCLGDADLHAVQGIRGPAPPTANHTHDHPKTLSALVGCDIDKSNCPQHMKPITYRAYALYSHAFVHHYLSWTVYLPDRLWDSLIKLHGDLEDLQCPGSKCASLHQCDKAMPLLYQHGIIPSEGTSKPSLTCSGLIYKLEEVVKGKPIASLMTCMDTFLYDIRMPFLFTVFTLWSVAIFFLVTYTMIYRMDVLRFRSHLLTTRASHLIDVKALLAGSRRMLSLYKDVDYFDDDPLEVLDIR